MHVQWVGAVMPEINRSLSNVGIGFAAFLSPPGPEVIPIHRWTTGFRHADSSRQRGKGCP